MFRVIKGDVKDIVCVCVCFCASDLGLRHNIEVVVIRGESHVSEDGPVVHRLNRLVLQSKRRSIYPDLEDRNRHKKHHILYTYSRQCCTQDVSLVLKQKPRYTYIKNQKL